MRWSSGALRGLETILARRRRVQVFGVRGKTRLVSLSAFRAAVLDAHDSGELNSMSSSQRAMFTAAFVRTAWGGRRNAGPGCAPVTYRGATIRELAPVVGVGVKQLGYAVKVLRSGRVDLVDDVRAGRVVLAEAVRALG